MHYVQIHIYKQTHKYLYMIKYVMHTCIYIKKWRWEKMSLCADATGWLSTFIFIRVCVFIYIYIYIYSYWNKCMMYTYVYMQRSVGEVLALCGCDRLTISPALINEMDKMTDAVQCVAVCCSVLQCVAVCCSVVQCVAACRSVLQCVAVCCGVLQCVAVCCI